MLIFSLFSQNVFSEDSTSSTTPESYTYEEFPEFLHQARRAEIITLGSLPFVLIGTSLVYGAVQYFSGQLDYFPNPLDKSNGYTEDQQKQILGISCGISLSIGAADLIITNVRKGNLKKKETEKSKNKILTVTPVSEDEVKFTRETVEEDENNDASYEVPRETE